MIKCNDPRLIDKGWQRYLLGSLHEELPYPEVPIKVYYRSRGKAEEERAGALLEMEQAAAVLAPGTVLDSPAEVVAHELHAVADA